MQAFRSVSRLAQVATAVRPAPGVSWNRLHSNLATLSFTHQRNRNKTEKSNLILHNIYPGYFYGNNFTYNINSGRCLRTKSRSLSEVRTETKTDKSSKDVASTTDDLKTSETTEDLYNSNKANGEEKKDTEEENLTIFQRFKRAYKEHGKILIGVHVVTSAVWFGSFFYAAKIGVDIVPLLEKWGFSETIIKPFKSSNVGNIALAYLMYKLATPARYTVTLGGTNLVIRHFRRTGRMAPKQKGDSLRELYKDSKDHLKERRHHMTSELRKSRIKHLAERRKQKRHKK